METVVLKLLKKNIGVKLMPDNFFLCNLYRECCLSNHFSLYELPMWQCKKLHQQHSLSRRKDYIWFTNEKVSTSGLPVSYPRQAFLTPIHGWQWRKQEHICCFNSAMEYFLQWEDFETSFFWKFAILDFLVQRTKKALTYFIDCHHCHCMMCPVVVEIWI